MKTTFSFPASALVAGLLAASIPVLRADNPPAVTNAPPKIELSLSAPAPAVAPATAPPAATPAAEADLEATPGQPRPTLTLEQPAIATAPAGFEPTPLTTSVRLDSGISPLTTQPQADAQRRLEPPKPDAMIAKYGTAGFLARQPEGRNFLDVINPFAPARFGPQPREVYNRDPNLKPGASLPRTFVSDGIKNEPEVNLFSWPW